MTTLKLVQKKTGLVIAKRQVRGGVDETKQRIMLDLTKRWGLKWEEDQK